MKARLGGIAILLLLAAMALPAQTGAPSVGDLRAGDRVVSGRAATDAVPIEIHDFFYSPPRLIGRGTSMDRSTATSRYRSTRRSSKAMPSPRSMPGDNRAPSSPVRAPPSPAALGD